MHYRAISTISAGIWAAALSAQTATPRSPGLQRFPGVPQFTVTARARFDLRPLLTSDGPAKTAVCSIPLLRVPVANNVERMPVLHPRADLVDNMPSVKLPAPPCEEEKR